MRGRVYKVKDFRTTHIKLWTEIFIVVILYLAVLTTGNYHFNPVLSLFGYHYYEVTVELSERTIVFMHVCSNDKVIRSVKKLEVLSKSRIIC